MYVYFDANGTLKEIISEKTFRVGDSKSDKIYVYWEGEHAPISGWVKYRKPDGKEYPVSIEECFYQLGDNLVAKELPKNPLRNLKYFSYDHTYEENGETHIGYKFYEIEVPDAVLNSSIDEEEVPTENNMVVARIRFVMDDGQLPNEIDEADSIETMGALVFAVETNIGILTDSSINETQYNYLISLVSMKIGYGTKSEKVASLPSDGVAGTIYYVERGDNGIVYDAYIWNGTEFVFMGTTSYGIYTKQEGDDFEVAIQALWTAEMNDYKALVNSNFENLSEDINNQLDYLTSFIQSAASGSPKGVYDTLSDLQSAYPSGTTGIYVVKADGHWYYWNSNDSSWADGGAYIEIPFDDFYNDESDNALQNKAITKTMNSIATIGKEEIGFLFYNGNINANGTISISDTASNYKVSDYIEIEKDGKYYVSGSANWYNKIYAFYDNTKTYISGQQGGTGSTPVGVSDELITIPNNAKYIVIAWVTSSSVGSVGKLEKKDVMLDKSLDIASKKAIENKVVAESFGNISNYDYCVLDIGYTVGSITSAGVIDRPSETSGYKVSELIEINPNNEYLLTACANWGNNIFAFYDENMNFISGMIGGSSSASVNLTNYELSIPKNAKYFAFAWILGRVQGNLKEKKTFLEELVDAYVPQKVGCVKGYYLNSSGAVAGSGQTADYIYQISTHLEVIPGSKIYINAFAHWGNSLYSIFDANDNVIQHEADSSGTGTGTTWINHEVSIPENASYIIISWRTNKLIYGALKYKRKMVKSVFLNKTWVCIGDSLTDNYNSVEPAKRYYDYISELTGINYVMMGVGGSGYAKLEGDSQAFYQRVLNAPADADVYTIFGSGNDLSSSKPLGTPSDSGTSTICGCIKQTLDNLYSINPIANVAIVAPTPWGASDLSDDTSNWALYVDALKTIAKNYGIPFLDLYHCSGLRPWNSDARALTYNENDSTHPNAKGHEYIASKFMVLLESMLI